MILMCRFTDAKSILGSQQLLMNHIATGQLNMRVLNSLSFDKLKATMLSIGFEECDITK
jgi:hypothetical protein